MTEVLEKYTYEDYALWEGDWELVDGVPQAMSPSPMREHQLVVNLICFELTEDTKECEECDVVSELDYIIDDENVLRPDVALICGEENDFITKAPKVIVEVLSPSTAKR
jgi:Uma2 family endonuclease